MWILKIEVLGLEACPGNVAQAKTLILPLFRVSSYTMGLASGPQGPGCSRIKMKQCSQSWADIQHGIHGLLWPPTQCSPPFSWSEGFLWRVRFAASPLVKESLSLSGILVMYKCSCLQFHFLGQSIGESRHQPLSLINAVVCESDPHMQPPSTDASTFFSIPEATCQEPLNQGSSFGMWAFWKVVGYFARSIPWCTPRITSSL